MAQSRWRTTFETFVRFSTDIVGLERALRLLQSISQILTTDTPLLILCLNLISLILPVFTTTTPSFAPPPSSSYSTTEADDKASPEAAVAANATMMMATAVTAELLTLKKQLSTTRKIMRAFKFLEAFRGGYLLLFSNTTTPKSAASILNGLSKSLLATYYLLETVALPHTLGLSVLSPLAAESSERWGGIEAQRFWCAGLGVGIVGEVWVLIVEKMDGVGEKMESNGVAMRNGVVKTGACVEKESEKDEMVSEKTIYGATTSKQEENKDEDWCEKHLTLQGDTYGLKHLNTTTSSTIPEKTAEKRIRPTEIADPYENMDDTRATNQQRNTTATATSPEITITTSSPSPWRLSSLALSKPQLKILSDVLDLTIPASALALVPLTENQVSWAMLASTLVTGRDVWVKCGTY